MPAVGAPPLARLHEASRRQPNHWVRDDAPLAHEIAGQPLRQDRPGSQMPPPPWWGHFRVPSHHVVSGGLRPPESPKHRSHGEGAAARRSRVARCGDEGAPPPGHPGCTCMVLRRRSSGLRPPESPKGQHTVAWPVVRLTDTLAPWTERPVVCSWWPRGWSPARSSAAPARRSQPQRPHRPCRRSSPSPLRRWSRHRLFCPRLSPRRRQPRHPSPRRASRSGSYTSRRAPTSRSKT